MITEHWACNKGTLQPVFIRPRKIPLSSTNCSIGAYCQGCKPLPPTLQSLNAVTEILFDLCMTACMHDMNANLLTLQTKTDAELPTYLVNINPYLDPDHCTKHSPGGLSCNKRSFSAFLLCIPDIRCYCSFFVWHCFVARSAVLPLLPADKQFEYSDPAYVVGSHGNHWISDIWSAWEKCYTNAF